MACSRLFQACSTSHKMPPPPLSIRPPSLVQEGICLLAKQTNEQEPPSMPRQQIQASHVSLSRTSFCLLTKHQIAAPSPWYSATFRPSSRSNFCLPIKQSNGQETPHLLALKFSEIMGANVQILQALLGL